MDLFDYEENVCEFKEFVEQISPNILESISIKETGKVILSLFGTLAQLLTLLSNCIFSLTTFAAIFTITVNYYKSTSNSLTIFGNKRKILVDQISKLLYATVIITVEHLFLGIIVF